MQASKSPNNFWDLHQGSFHGAGRFPGAPSVTWELGSGGLVSLLDCWSTATHSLCALVLTAHAIPCLLELEECFHLARENKPKTIVTYGSIKMTRKWLCRVGFIQIHSVHINYKHKETNTNGGHRLCVCFSDNNAYFIYLWNWKDHRRWFRLLGK